MARQDFASKTNVEHFIDFEPGTKNVKIVPREQVKKMMSSWRIQQEKFQDMGQSGGCSGCLLSAVEFLLDPTGKKRINSAEESLNKSVDQLSQQLAATIPIIETGLRQLENKSQPFVDMLPPESPAKALIEKFGSACLCEVTTLGNGTSIALLRGETKTSKSPFRHRHGAEENPNSQRSYLVTSTGEIFNISVQTYSTARDRGDLVAETSPIRKVFGRQLNHTGQYDIPDNKRREDFTVKIEKLIDGTQKYTQSNTIPNPIYANEYDKITLSKIESDSKNAGEDLKHHFLLSQKRAITVAYDIGVDQANKGLAYAVAME